MTCRMLSRGPCGDGPKGAKTFVSRPSFDCEHEHCGAEHQQQSPIPFDRVLQPARVLASFLVPYSGHYVHTRKDDHEASSHYR